MCRTQSISKESMAVTAIGVVNQSLARFLGAAVRNYPPRGLALPVGRTTRRTSGSTIKGLEDTDVESNLAEPVRRPTTCSRNTSDKDAAGGRFGAADVIHSSRVHMQLKTFKINAGFGTSETAETAETEAETLDFGDFGGFSRAEIGTDFEGFEVHMDSAGMYNISGAETATDTIFSKLLSGGF
ncbi:hypothetical protein B0H17DRAFT_1145938 [Mycena rosella]|uniref:Uncharacterized protein n=1 Tax=Mycena rosella TaxID=1033263 RepID=A0AAD7CPW2_MYCRO|nr:hypothetical protein B0H17DRAFT_1145938 [Mycena rosella]